MFASFGKSGVGLTLVWRFCRVLRKAFDRAGTYGRVAIVLVGFAALSVSSLSQEIPGPADPGRLEERFDEPAIPRATEEPTVPVPEIPEAEAPEGLRFQLRDVNIEGATVYTPVQLRALYQDFIGTSASLHELREISRRLTRKYRRDGYILTRAIVPVQNFADGIVRIRVVEGYVDDVRFDTPESMAPFGGDLLIHYTQKILASRPLKAADLERYLLLTSDLPGLTIRSVLQPSEKNVGAATLDLHLTQSPLSASINYDNRGSRFVGPKQSLASVFVNSLVQRFDQSAVRLALTRDSDELVFLELRYSAPVGSEGLRLSIEASHSDSEPGFTLRVCPESL